MSEEYTLGYLDERSCERWNRFVEGCPKATFFHLSQWKAVIEQAFGHKTYFMFAERAGEIQAVLPLAQVKSFLFGNALTSSPFCVYGGVAANDESSRRYLEDQACELADRLQVDYLEMRNLERSRDDWPCKELYVTFRKEISEDEDENLKAIPRKQRAVVRKGIKAELQSDIDQDINDFYSAYSTSVRNLGTPVFSKKYFRVLKEIFGADCDILTIRKDQKLIASVMNFYFRDEVLPYYGGGTDEARQVKGNDFMYWSLMCHASKRGVRTFDYGRSKIGTGPFSFKKNWGFEPQPLFYEYHLVKATEMPDINPMNPKYNLMVNAWKKLPLALSQFIGPMVSKYLG
ncbi:MAG: FemAB family PEP-CTERM system-associated protein [Pseudomonadales bacterium]|nr:FemAB family PEP-CTERM system-associated protein [Pseudomonadales bacterium]